MVPVIRISDATWARLKQWAEPFEDSPEDALRKVIAIAEEYKHNGKLNISNREEINIVEENTKKDRIKRGLKTPNSKYIIPILEALLELGGRATTSEALDVVETKVSSSLNEYDLQRLPSGNDLRWRNAAQWVRFGMVKSGFLKKDSPQGVWELSEAGANYLEDSRSQ